MHDQRMVLWSAPPQRQGTLFQIGFRAHGRDPLHDVCAWIGDTLASQASHLAARMVL
jgi:hypothetical protein